MGKLKEKYKLNKNITEQLLKENGFRNGVYREYLYKDLIVLFITIDIKENWWTYQVCNTDKNFTLYIPYYNRYTGVNSIVENIDKKLNILFRRLEKQNVFTKIKKR